MILFMYLCISFTFQVPYRNLFISQNVSSGVIRADLFTEIKLFCAAAKRRATDILK